MASLSERIALIIDFNGDKAIKGLENVARASQGADKESRDLQKSLTSMGATGLAASGIAAVGLSKLAGKASDLNEVTSKTNVIFGDAADSVIAFAKDAGKALGQSETAALEAATSVAQMGKAAGFAGQDLADFSTDLVTLASDLASFNNTSPEEAITALGAALRGESDPIRAYGVLLDDATLKQRALSMGLIETTTGTLPPAIKVQAAYAEILAQTTDAQGDFARTADGAANQQRILKAELENLATGIGTGLLPAFSAVVSGAADAVGALNNMDDGSKRLLGTMAAGGTGIVAAVSGISLLTGQLMKMKNRFIEVGEAGKQLTTAGKFAAGAAIGIGVLTTAVALMEENSRRAEVRVQELKDAMVELGVTAEEAAKKKIYEFVASQGDVVDALRETGLSLEDVTSALTGNAEDVERVTGALDTYVGQMERSGRGTQNGAQEARRLSTELKNLRGDIATIAEEEAKAAKAKQLENEAASKQNETKGESARLNAVLGKTTVKLAEDTDELSEADKELAERQKAVEESAKKAADALDERRRATEEAYEAARASVDPLLRERAAQRDLAAAAADVTAKTKEASDAKFKDAAKNNEVVSAQDGLIEKLADVAGAYVEAKGKALDSREGAELYVAKLRELRDQYGPNLGPAISIYDELIRRIDETIRKQSAVAGVGTADRPYNPGGGVRVNSFGSDLPGGGFSPTVPGFGGAGMTVNVTLTAPLVTQQAAQWVADQLAVLIRTNGVGALPFAGVTAKV